MSNTPDIPGPEPGDPAWLRREYDKAALAPPVHNALAVIAFLAAFIAPLAGAILGHVSNRESARAGRRRSGLAVAATWIGWALTILAVIVMIAVIAAAMHGPAAGS